MKIVICGSMSFARQMIFYKKKLEKKGHQVFISPTTFDFVSGKRKKGPEEVGYKKEIDALKLYFKKIKKADAILVLNYKHKNINGFIGGNTLIEMGFAHVLNKKIYLLNKPSKKLDYITEILFMEPVFLEKKVGQINKNEKRTY